MESRIFQISEQLEKLSRSSNRFSSRVKPEVDYEQEYTAVYQECGFSDIEIQNKLDDWELSKIKAVRFFKNNPDCQAVRDVLDDIYASLKESDTRSEDFITYNIAVVIFVVLLAGISGCNNDDEIAEYWFTNNMALQHLVPGMPSPGHMISDETVRTIRKLVPEEVMQDIFEKYFNQIKISIADRVMNKDYESQNYRHT